MGETRAGRRERRKAATRDTILDAALSLFFQHGFTAVTVREIADLADVTPKTVFAHFPRKEALVFSDEDARNERLVRAVLDRSDGTSISRALADHYLTELHALQTEPQRRVLQLMHDTPALVEYAERLWLLHEGALADAIAQDLGLPEPTTEVRLYARFALQVQLHASRSDHPEHTIAAGFQLLDHGWDWYLSAGR